MQLIFFLFGSSQYLLHYFLVEYLFFAELFGMCVDCHHYYNAFLRGIFKLDQLTPFQKCNGFPIIETALD
jgi:hypothetical protein